MERRYKDRESESDDEERGEKKSRTAGVLLKGRVHRAPRCTEIFQRTSPIIRRHDVKDEWFNIESLLPPLPLLFQVREVHLSLRNILYCIICVSEMFLQLVLVSSAGQ